MMTVNTVQGIGDIFWVYQKLAHHVDKINWRIWRISNDPVQYRAKDFALLLTKTETVAFPLVDLSQYHALARTTFPLAQVLEHDTVNYAVNAALESGLDLYTMDHGYFPESFVPFEHLTMAGMPPVEDALCLFVSGSRLDFVWDVNQWAEYTSRIMDQLSIHKIRVIGTTWDEWAANEVTILLQRMGYEVRNFCSKISMSLTIDTIRSSYFFFGYQSGLSVIAENYNVPQIMMYFPHLKDMLYTWAKPANRRTRYFATTFDNPNIGLFIDEATQRYCLESRRQA